jgi:hypothetical protein
LLQKGSEFWRQRPRPFGFGTLEGRIDLLGGVGVEDIKLQPEQASGLRNVVSAIVALVGLTSMAT